MDLSEPLKYIPSIFSDKALHEHIRNLLLRKPVAFNSSLQDRLNGVNLSSTLVVTNTGEVIPAYHLKDTLDYLVIDLHKYLLSSKQVNECQCCQRLFYPKIRKTEKYCRLPHRDTHLLCNKIIEQQKKSNDKFAVARDKARGYQHQQIYRDWKEKGYTADFVRQLYDGWSNECSMKFVEYSRKDDLQGFTDWLESTKFTARELKRLWAEYQANGSTPYHTSAED